LSYYESNIFSNIICLFLIRLISYKHGNSKPIHLMEFIKTIENKLNIKAIIKFEPLRKGDVIKLMHPLLNYIIIMSILLKLIWKTGLVILLIGT